MHRGHFKKFRNFYLDWRTLKNQSSQTFFSDNNFCLDQISTKKQQTALHCTICNDPRDVLEVMSSKFPTAIMAVSYVTPSSFLSRGQRIKAKDYLAAVLKDTQKPRMDNIAGGCYQETPNYTANIVQNWCKDNPPWVLGDRGLVPVDYYVCSVCKVDVNKRSNHTEIEVVTLVLRRHMTYSGHARND